MEDEDVDVFAGNEDLDRPQAPSSSRKRLGHSKIEIESSDVELFIEEDHDDIHLTDPAPPSPKRRKLEVPSSAMSPRTGSGFASARTVLVQDDRKAGNSAAQAAAATVSSLGLRSFFKNLAPGMRNIPLFLKFRLPHAEIAFFSIGSSLFG